MEKLERRSPEFKVYVEYEANCPACGFKLADQLQDANEKDALSNVRAICDGWHYTTNRVANHTCGGELEIKTKIGYWT